MKKPRHPIRQPELRQAAEARLKGDRPHCPTLREAELRRLVYELEIHQEELMLQQEELVASQAELAAALERYTNLYDLAPVGYLTLDANGIIHLANLTAARMAGLPRSRLVGRRFASLVAGKDRPVFDDFRRRVLSTGTSQSCTLALATVGREADASLTVGLEATLSPDSSDCRLVMLNVTKRKQAEVALELSRKRLRTLSERVQTLREEERTRISREIHDVLGQMLTGIKMDLRWIEHRLEDIGDEPRVNPILDKLVAAGELTDATLKATQRIAAELRPGTLDHLGLPQALEEEAARFEERTGISCRVGIGDGLPPIGRATATAFFRVFQEALTNVARHARATAVEARLWSGMGDCRLEISDNGQGIRNSDIDHPDSLGLLGMRERARLLGGDVAFDSRPGGGTIVTIRIPVDTPVQERACTGS